MTINADGSVAIDAKTVTINADDTNINGNLTVQDGSGNVFIGG